VTDTGPDPGLSAASGILGTIGGALVAGCGAGGTIIGAVACGFGVFAVFLSALFSIVANIDHGHTTTFSPEGRDNDFVPPDGPSAAPPGLPTESAPSSTVNFVNLLPPLPTEASDPMYQLPGWWKFPGRWGVLVERRMSSGWDSGTRRMDRFGRTRGYWNALQLFNWLNLPENSRFMP